MNKGFVSLVGAGPGDPDLMTVKAVRLLNEADVVVYDRLVSPEIMKLIPKGVSCISVGKSPGHHCVPQTEINQLLVTLARKGRHVLRLKGGDPYLFGRGGEEALVLNEHNIPFQVVPGITAAAGCGAYSGIPLTHRGMTHGVRFLTGHTMSEDTDAEGESTINWEKIADPDCTLAIYMGLSGLDNICTQLIKAGLAASTPAAAIHEGTTRDQQKLISTLDSLAKDVKSSQLKSPVLVIIGEVVSLNESLNWFQSIDLTDARRSDINESNLFEFDATDIAHV